MKIALTVFILSSFLVGGLLAQERTQTFRGRVTDHGTGGPLPGCTVLHLGSNTFMVADQNGEFSIQLVAGFHEFQLSYVGFETRRLGARIPMEKTWEVVLMPEEVGLQAVEVFSTGYQELPRERATGSFAHLDRELVNRRFSTDILSRLEDLTPGLVFNRNIEGRKADISIRGQNTLFANTSPLVVVDNFPYDGDINNINPNDVESVTVLRDAAAASIWGARAGNGVIVITTKRGKAGPKPLLTFSHTTNAIQRPDAYYPANGSPSDFVDTERLLFQRGFYNGAVTNINRPPLSPVVETLLSQRNGTITDAEANERINSLAAHDVRDDYNAYIYGAGLQNQTFLNLRGGTQSHTYNVSTGYDRNTHTLRGNLDERLSLNMGNRLSLANDRLNVGVAIYYARTRSSLPNPGPAGVLFNTGVPIYPYARLADASGSPLPVSAFFRDSFREQGEAQGLLDWSYVPLEEIFLNTNTSTVNDVRINTDLSFKIAKGLTLEVLHQFWGADGRNISQNTRDSFTARNLINTYTSLGENNLPIRPIPLGGIYSTAANRSSSNNLRGMARYGGTWTGSRLDLFLGAEVKDMSTQGSASRVYGYNDLLGISQPVDFVTQFPLYYNPGQRRAIPNGDSFTFLTDRFVSFFGNGAYTYRDRYVFSASARRDASNIFGVETNQKWVPLWSAGFSWIISEEAFFGADWIGFLRLKSTIGTNGNVDKTLSSLTTVNILPGSLNSVTGLPFGRVVNPPNPNLVWEKIRMLNLGLDFELKDQILSGNIEFYRKQGLDLIGNTPYAPSSGITEFRTNYAATTTTGADLSLSSVPVDRRVKWHTQLIASFVNEKVSAYNIDANVNQLVRTAAGSFVTVPIPNVGKPLWAVYSYPWAGLNPANGNPVGILDGEPSENYLAIFNASTLDNIRYHGPARPTRFGSWRNTVSYGRFSLSVLVNYRFGYYYRRSSVNYNTILNGRPGHADFADRWQNPGDESRTQIPSMPGSVNNNRDNLFLFSEALVEKGDHIRLQDIRLGYVFSRTDIPRFPFQSMEIFGLANNLGILWKASEDRLDPDFRNMNPLKSFALGLRIDL